MTISQTGSTSALQGIDGGSNVRVTSTPREKAPCSAPNAQALSVSTDIEISEAARQLSTLQENQCKDAHQTRTVSNTWQTERTESVQAVIQCKNDNDPEMIARKFLQLETLFFKRS